MIRGEALYSPRSQWYVCFPGTASKDRLTNFKGAGRDPDEFHLAQRCLELFTALAGMGVEGKDQLMKAGDTARSAMRKTHDISDADLMFHVLEASGLSREEVEDRMRSKAVEVEDRTGAESSPHYHQS